MTNYISRFLGKIKSWGLNKSGFYVMEKVKEIPEEFRKRIVYLEGDKEDNWTAALSCPCGCEAKIYLNLIPDTNPCWVVSNSIRASVRPSVWRLKDCKSHFVLKNGKIKWC